MGPIWALGVTVIIIIVVFKYNLLKNHQARIFRVYILPNNLYYFKYVLVFALLAIRKKFVKFFAKKPGFGAGSHNDPMEMDQRQPLSTDPKAFDAVYMNGANRIGWRLIAGLALRPYNVDGFLILQVPGVGLLLSPKLPDTVLKEHEGDFSSEGLTLQPRRPMRRWHLQYDGYMRYADDRSETRVHVTIDAKWKSLKHYFNYDTDIPLKNIARAISTEPWSRKYFKFIREHHQTHYEQFGDLTGIATIDGIEFNLNMSVMRDHSFGIRREWKLLHRYVIHIFTLADKTCGTVGIVCIPNMFSRLEVGYVYDKEGSLNAACDTDFELYQHGEEGTPPTDYGFCFTAGKTRYEVQVKVEKWTELFVGLEWEARIVESLSRFTVNGVEGWGAVEWMYSHDGGRPKTTAL